MQDLTGNILDYLTIRIVEENGEFMFKQLSKCSKFDQLNTKHNGQLVKIIWGITECQCHRKKDQILHIKKGNLLLKYRHIFSGDVCTLFPRTRGTVTFGIRREVMQKFCNYSYL